MDAKTIMSEVIHTVTPENSILDIAEIMLSKDVSCVPVIGENGKFLGIVTTGDILLKLRGSIKEDPLLNCEKLLRMEIKLYGITAYEVMTVDIITVAPDCQINQLAEIMIDNNINNLVVVENDQVVGLIGRKNLLQYFSDCYE